MTQHLATCTCGQLTLSAEGEPRRVSVCHCLNCQRRSGSAFAVQARFAKANVVIRGVSKEYALTGDEGGIARFHFCPECGATVYYRADAFPDEVAVPVGAFADPDFPSPTMSNYGERKHRWVRLDDGIAQNA